ncbi:MAG: hypothetical protein JWR61_1526 [Ferruginibacter sp.]|nr:hypothetical protein [Ferruginibacter sp.]
MRDKIKWKILLKMLIVNLASEQENLQGSMTNKNELIKFPLKLNG